MTVAHMRRVMSTAEGTAWKALYSLEADERKAAEQKARQKSGRKR